MACCKAAKESIRVCLKSFFVIYKHLQRIARSIKTNNGLLPDVRYCCILNRGADRFRYTSAYNNGLFCSMACCTCASCISKLAFSLVSAAAVTLSSDLSPLEYLHGQYCNFIFLSCCKRMQGQCPGSLRKLFQPVRCTSPMLCYARP